MYMPLVGQKSRIVHKFNQQIAECWMCPRVARTQQLWSRNPPYDASIIDALSLDQPTLNHPTHTRSYTSQVWCRELLWSQIVMNLSFHLVFTISWKENSIPLCREQTTRIHSQQIWTDWSLLHTLRSDSCSSSFINFYALKLEAHSLLRCCAADIQLIEMNVAYSPTTQSIADTVTVPFGHLGPLKRSFTYFSALRLAYLCVEKSCLYMAKMRPRDWWTANKSI